MIHLRIDDEVLNKNARFACGIGWPLPTGDKYLCDGALAAYRVDCPNCNPNGPKQFGTPISQLSGQPGGLGYAEFLRIARSWGYD